MARDIGEDMKYLACTSFSPKGYEVYGRRFLESYLAFWPTEIVVFYEGQKPDLKSDRVLYLDLLQDPEFREFQSEYGYWGTNDYRLAATKFSPKVFSITSNRIPEWEWLIWIDADVVTKRLIDDRFFEETCPGGYTGAYLGRMEWDHSECGFVSYRKQYFGKEFLEDFRSLYTTGGLFSLPQWHDSYAFDYIREQNENYRFHNLSDKIPGNHVWPHTILGEYMDHQKGPKLKTEIYGDIA